MKWRRENVGKNVWNNGKIVNEKIKNSKLENKKWRQNESAYIETRT